MEFDVSRDPDIQGDLQALQNTLLVIDGLDAAQYVRPAGGPGSASIGKHVRRIVDVYECFLNSIAEGSVDYDAMNRSPLLESSGQHARERLATLGNRLSSLTEPDDAVCVDQQR